MRSTELARQPVTLLLRRWREGDQAAFEELATLLYPELRRIAATHMRGERIDHTLQPTAVVHEAYTRLIDLELEWQDRVHFLSMASRVMRRVLVDHARAARAAKRGGEGVRVPLEEERLVVEPSCDALDLDRALEQLAAHQERPARVVELHYFGGLSYREIAAAVGTSEVTVERDLRFAKAWLRRRLEPGSS
jgi:RNA polymerase sigma factor (TIGR02999 family)